MGNGMKRQHSLLSQILWQFSLCLIAIFAMATPLFYLLTKHFYAEDMEDLIKAVKAGRDIPAMDLEADIMAGMMIQYFIILAILAIALLLTLRLLTRRLWRPFEQTLGKIERYDLAHSDLPHLPEERTREFSQLNKALTALLKKDRRIYQAQKEFTENASHELQTPLAITRSKLDLLIQTGPGAEASRLIDDLYGLNMRMERLNRNLLLLAKIDNGQYDITGDVDPHECISQLLSGYKALYSNITYTATGRCPGVKANTILFECMLNNLVANAIRHTPAGGGAIGITLGRGDISVSNAAGGAPLDAGTMFRRFSKGGQQEAGCGLGLAIVKAICQYHGWGIHYDYRDNTHCFTVSMLPGR